MKKKFKYLIYFIIYLILVFALAIVFYINGISII